MSGIAVFVPDQEMYGQVEEILKEKEYHVKVLKVIETEEAVYEARKAISEQGINIIVARGKQLANIRWYTNVAVSEIQMTGQEMGVLVNRAKAAVGKENPKIAVFYWENMLCDTTYFDELYGVRLLRYQFKEDEEWRSVFARACEDHPDIIIGGKSTREAADRQGIPSLAFFSTGESIRTAMDNAESLYRMAQAEQRNYAQFSTILDSSFNGIMKVTNNGTVLVMNRVMEQITGVAEKNAVGMPVGKLFGELDGEILSKVISGGMENYTTFINQGSSTLVMVIEPIMVEGRPEGAILSCNRLKRLEIEEENRLHEQYLRGYVAHGTFEDIEQELPGLKDTIRLAKLYAQSSSPVLIEGYAGPEQDAICQGIHNYSLRKNNPFIAINLAGMSEDQQMKTLFGSADPKGKDVEKGAVWQADKGTLVIQSIDKMTLPVQYHFSKMLRSRRILFNSIENMKIVDIRIIACTSKDIDTCRRLNRMRSDLYYSLNALKIKIPGLCQRPDDMAYLLDSYMKKYMDQYYRYHAITAGARKMLLAYGWPGNTIQMRSFCERMILTVGRRTITEEYVTGLLEELYEHTQEPDYYIQHGLTPPGSQDAAGQMQTGQGMPNGSCPDPAPTNSGRDRIRETIIETLQLCNGNRTLTAKKMGISTTTLWRKMKLYGIEI